MPVKEHQCTNYSDLRVLLQKLEGEGEVYVFFSCTLDHHGDPVVKLCFAADDALLEYIEFLRNRKTTIQLIYFRADLDNYYKCNSNFARNDSLRIFAVPAIIKWRGFKRLTGRQCCKIPLLAMLFEDESRSKFTLFNPCSYFKSEKVLAVDNEEDAELEIDGERIDEDLHEGFEEELDGETVPTGKNESLKHVATEIETQQ